MTPAFTMTATEWLRPDLEDRPDPMILAIARRARYARLQRELRRARAHLCAAAVPAAREPAE